MRFSCAALPGAGQLAAAEHRGGEKVPTAGKEQILVEMHQRAMLRGVPKAGTSPVQTPQPAVGTTGVQIVTVLSLQLPGQQWDELLQSSPDVWRGPGEPEVFSMVSVGEEPHLERVLHHPACFLHVNSHSERVSPGVKIYSLAHFDQGTEELLAMEEEVGG